MNRVGIITGMVAEARCLPRPDAGDVPAFLCSGGDAGRAAECACRLLAEGADGLLSFGLAGGLDRALRVGAVVVADGVIGPDGERWSADGAWRDALLAAPGELRFTVGDVAGSDRALVSATEKAELFAATRAHTVDMESHAVARVAVENNVPFAVLRVVADTATRTLPQAALAGIGADGQTRPAAVLSQLVLRPWDLPAMLVLALVSARALRSLRRVAAASPAPLLGGGLA